MNNNNVIRVGTFFSGIGSPEKALERLKREKVIDNYEEEYYCHSIFVVMSILWGESTGETIF